MVDDKPCLSWCFLPGDVEHLGRRQSPSQHLGTLGLAQTPKGGTCLLGEERVDTRSQPRNLLVTSLEKFWLLYELLGFEPDLCPPSQFARSLKSSFNWWRVTRWCLSVG